MATPPPPQLRGVCAVSPVMELGRCVDALERRSNVVYQWNFVRGLRARMRRKDARASRALRPGAAARASGPCASSTTPTPRRSSASPARGLLPPRQRAARRSTGSRCPALIITAEDDPFVPAEPFRDPGVTANPHITLDRHEARRPLRLPRPSRPAAATATGRSSDRRVRQQAALRV